MISVKSINQKMRRLARKYGTSNTIYQQFVTIAERNFQTHKTKEGILQISNPKTAAKTSYQKQLLNRFDKYKGVKELEKTAKQRLVDIGKKRPSKSEIEHEVRRQTERQGEIDNVLNAIYDDEKDGSLPVDIAEKVDKMRNRGSGGGQGVTIADIDYMIDKTREWSDIKKELNTISQRIKNDYPESKIDINATIAIDNAEKGRMSVDDVKITVDKLREYYDKMQQSDHPELVSY